MAGDQAEAVMQIILLGFAGILFYLLPMIIAISRKHRNRLAIGVTNVIVGWTVLGWIASLIWACTANVEAPNARGASA